MKYTFPIYTDYDGQFITKLYAIESYADDTIEITDECWVECRNLSTIVSMQKIMKRSGILDLLNNQNKSLRV